MNLTQLTVIIAVIVICMAFLWLMSKKYFK
jgi:hypothetical protein